MPALAGDYRPRIDRCGGRAACGRSHSCRLPARDMGAGRAHELHRRQPTPRLSGGHDRHPRHRRQLHERNHGLPGPQASWLGALRHFVSRRGDTDGRGERHRLARRQLGLQHPRDRDRARGIRLQEPLHDPRVPHERGAGGLHLLAVGGAHGSRAHYRPLPGARPGPSRAVRRQRPSHRSRAVLELELLHIPCEVLRESPSESSTHGAQRHRV